jgi:two-component system response regulator FlrC
MITGESGTGKEVLFRTIHDQSRRASEPCVAINCAAIPGNMLEAILFGYEKGAFTGAYKACPGKFEQAQGGTLLLDEISEMELGLQAKLLRVLQERQVERLGGTKATDLDVRVIATSNRNLREEVAAGRFREDLYYRLNVFPILMPPLRDRPQDIIPLAEFLLGCAARASHVSVPLLDDEAQEQLLHHRWPGNVRELDNVVQRALIIHSGATIGVRDLQLEEINPREATTALVRELPEGLGESLKDREQSLILDALDEGKGSRKFAAEKLGISARTLRYKIARLREQGLEIPASR